MLQPGRGPAIAWRATRSAEASDDAAELIAQLGCVVVSCMLTACWATAARTSSCSPSDRRDGGRRSDPAHRGTRGCTASSSVGFPLGGQLMSEHVLAFVMTDAVKPALGMQAATQIAIGDQDPLLVIERPGDDVARRRFDDRCAAAAKHVLAGR